MKAMTDERWAEIQAEFDMPMSLRVVGRSPMERELFEEAKRLRDEVAKSTAAVNDLVDSMCASAVELAGGPKPESSTGAVSTGGDQTPFAGDQGFMDEHQ